jgi:hypothetical protein
MLYPGTDTSSGKSFEHYLTSPLSIPGFPDGDIYVGDVINPDTLNEVDQIMHIANSGIGGFTVFATLPPGSGQVRGILFDRIGTFGNNMLVVTKQGNIYTIPSSGIPKLLASIGEDGEGMAVLPLNSAFYPGELIVVSEGAVTCTNNNGTLRVISPTGGKTIIYSSPLISCAEIVSYVPLNLGASGSPLEGYYEANYGTGMVSFAPASQFTTFIGHLIVTQESASVPQIFDFKWNDSSKSFDLPPKVIGTFPTQPEDGIFVTPDMVRNAFIEVCKASCPTNPVPPSGIYNFTVQSSVFNAPANPLMVPFGECSGPIPVGVGMPTIAELLTPGVSVCNVTAVGYNPSTGFTDLLVPGSFNQQKGTAEVIVQAPATAGDTSTETLVTFMNQSVPPAELKVCKIAGVNINYGTSYNFTEVNITNAGSGYLSAPLVTIPGGGCKTAPTATASISGGSVTGITLTSPGSGCSASPPLVVTITPPPSGLGNMQAMATAAIVSVEAGPPDESGYCVLVPGTFQVGTTGTVTEMVPAGDGVPAITVNGASATPSPCGSSPLGFPCGVATLIGQGINEVSFTNCTSSTTASCVPLPLPGGLAIDSYSLVSQVAATGAQSYMTYRADLLNSGKTILNPLIAMLSSLDPSIRVVGSGVLDFASAPANSQVTSSNTFTILTDPTVPLDFSKLSWSYYSKRSVPSAPPRRR